MSIDQGVAGMEVAPQARVWEAINDLKRQVATLRRPDVVGQQRGFGYIADDLAIDWNDEVDAGPEVAVMVPDDSNLVAVYAEALITTTSGNRATVSLLESTDYPTGSLMFGLDKNYSSPQLASTGTGSMTNLGAFYHYVTGGELWALPPFGTFRVVPATPGLRTYSLRFSSKGEAASGGFVFAKRKLQVVVL